MTRAILLIGCVALGACWGGDDGPSSVSSNPASAGDTATDAFCELAKSILGVDDIGDDPGKLRAQMDELITAGENLAEGSRNELARRVEEVTDVLELAEQGRAPSGWSSDKVVEVVVGVCGPEGLLSWTVQP